MNTNTETAMSRFLKEWDEIGTEVPFNEKWNNGTGYMDGAVHDKTIPHGLVVKSVTPSPNDRKIIIMGNPGNNVVIFQRYTDGQSGIVVHNAKTEWDKEHGVNGMGSLNYTAVNLMLEGKDGWKYPHPE